MSDENNPPKEIDLAKLGEAENQNLAQARQRAAILKAEYEEAERAKSIALGRMQMLEELSRRK